MGGRQVVSGESWQGGAQRILKGKLARGAQKLGSLSQKIVNCIRSKMYITSLLMAVDSDWVIKDER